MTSAVPSGKTARTSRTRMDSFTFSLRFCLRGGKFLPGYIWGYTFDGKLRKPRGWRPTPPETLSSRIEMVRIGDKRNLRQIQCTPKRKGWGVSLDDVQPHVLARGRI